ncbi:2-polyprenylphenol 6-hydroxylase [Tepidicaulis sp. LMO-SS28]|uniref:2-polyprenylphenol 6-hydroxylase n=1 Tax=Tepidicaulis sp. LMO-SS28 TaxID=3447455 RepID=UPI003EE41843
MIRALRNIRSLVRAARVMARHDALFELDLAKDNLPPIALALRPFAKLRFPWERRVAAEGDIADRLSAALSELGPSYIKLGQFLATRPDMIGPELAGDLGLLRDQIPPFDQAEAEAMIEEQLGAPVPELFETFSHPVAAASIAQVHKATVRNADGTVRDVAVKVLRPDVEARFRRDLDAFFWVAEKLERFFPETQRLRPVAGVQTLAASVELEMDLRLEAAAMSEMAENTKGDPGFRVPEVDWNRTARQVLTLEWIDATPAGDREALIEAGHDMKRLGNRVIQNFLLHATRDGFFHADMHQGNLFVAGDGTLIPVDFGIMGRLDERSRRFLAEILYGFVKRDYARVAEVHFEAGYVPGHKDVATFAQALRSIGEPIFGKDAQDVSMGKLLAQLFLVTEQFDMAMRPELLLLQKTMVVVEGVARFYDPEHNIWEASEPILADWMMRKLGPEARLQEAAGGMMALGRRFGELPDLLDRAERAIDQATDPKGIRLHPDSLTAIREAENKGGRMGRAALWLGALSLFGLLLTQIF